MKKNDCKKALRAAFVAAVCVALGSCQVYQIVKDATDKEDGTVTLTDGSELTGRVLMPNVNTKSISITTLDSVKHKFPADSVAYLTLWKKTHPEMQHTLIHASYRKLNKKATVTGPYWMALIEAGENAYLCAQSFNYSIPQSGRIKIQSVKGGTIAFIAFKKGDPVGHLLGYMSAGYRFFRKTEKQVFADDKYLCRQLDSLTVSPGNLEEVIRAYTPGRE